MSDVKLENITIDTENGIKNLAELTDEEFEQYVKDLGFNVKESKGGWSYSSRQMFVNYIKRIVDDVISDEEII